MTTRRRDASASRTRLLDAARGLFAERGLERTTTREIGELAGVDAALIARYFGSKAGLYIATLSEADDGPVPDLLQPGRLASLLARLARGGPGPVLQATVHSGAEPLVHEAARAELHRRLVQPLAARYSAAGSNRAELAAEVAVAAFAGVALARSAGTLEQLRDADPDEVVTLVEQLLSSLA